MNRSLAWILLAALLAHAGGLANGFVYDDHRFVEGNDALVDLTPTTALLDASSHTPDGDRDVYRPLRALSHAHDLARWGPDPFGFHLHSLLLHLLNVVLAFVAVSRLLPAVPRAAPFAALVLAVHPLGVEVAGWISSRGDLLALTFGLLALLATTLPGPPAGRLLGGLVCAALACLGKESAAVLPALAWAHQALVTRRRDLPALVGLTLGVLVAFSLRHLALSGATPVQTPPHGGSWLAQTGWALYGWGRTLGHLVLPTGLSVDPPVARWQQGGPVFLRLFTLVGLAVALVPLALRRSRPTLAFLVAWMGLAYLPSSSLIVTLRTLLNDRGAYPVLPAAGALLGLALARVPGALSGGLAVALALGLGLAAQQRTADFHDDETLWRQVLEDHPDSVVATLGLAEAARLRGDLDTCEELLARAVDLAPHGSKRQAAALVRLGDFLLRIRRDAPGAIPILEQAVGATRRWSDTERPWPEEDLATAALVEALFATRQSPRGRVVIEDALTRSARPALLLIKLAQLEGALGSEEATERARDALTRAARLEPGHPALALVEDWLANLSPGR